MSWQQQVKNFTQVAQARENVKMGQFRLECRTTGAAKETLWLSFRECGARNRELAQSGSTYHWKSTSERFKTYI